MSFCWQNKSFLGRGEFALEFGDYHVEITVPDNHIVARARRCPLFVGELAVRRRGRMDDQRAAVADIRQMAEQLDGFDKPDAGIVTAPNAFATVFFRSPHSYMAQIARYRAGMQC